MSDSCSCEDSVTESHWTPRVLPCVYLFPPEEDEASIVCVFPNNRPDPFASTPRTSGDVFYQVPDALDDEEGVQYGVSTYMGSYSVSYQGTKPSNGRSRSTNAQLAKTLNRKRNRAEPYAPVSHTPNECENEAIFTPPPPSRRSSVFEDRSTSPEPMTFKNLEVSPEETSSSLSSPLDISIRSSSLSSSFKEKARTAFKTFRRPTLKRRKEPVTVSKKPLQLSEPVVTGPPHEDAFLVGLKKKKNRRSLMSFFNSSSSSINLTGGVEHHTQNSTDLSSPAKGKIRPMPNTYSSTGGSQLVPDAENSKLSRRRSITQIFSRKPRPSSGQQNKNKSENPAQTGDPPERRRSLSTPSESETGDDDEPKSPVIMLRETTDVVMGDDSDLVPTSRGLSRPKPLDMAKVTAGFSNRFSLHVDDSPSTDSPIMELAVQLNSLDFNHLDPGIYSDTNEDD